MRFVGRWSTPPPPAATGFGFIKQEDGGDDIFCHFSAIRDGNQLEEGAPVEYKTKYDAQRGE